MSDKFIGYSIVCFNPDNGDPFRFEKVKFTPLIQDEDEALRLAIESAVETTNELFDNNPKFELKVKTVEGFKEEFNEFVCEFLYYADIGVKKVEVQEMEVGSKRPKIDR